MTTLNRRNFLTLGSMTTTAILLSQCSKQGQPPNRSVLPSTPPGEGTVPSPPYRSTNGLLDVELTAQPQSLTLGDRTANLLTYNGQLPGPILEARPGDTVRITFRNQLSQPTNLHYHGLHIPPTGSGDNAFLAIAPGEQHTYEFQIPTDHPAGTFWYHPHHHGMVAEQLFAGLAGLFIIRGELDEIPEIVAAQEEFLVLKDIMLNPDGSIPDPGHMAQMTGRIGDLVTVSGLFNPTLTLAKGGLWRLRLLNASPSRFFRLALENHLLHLIATDGGAIATPVELETLTLAPGERAEVLVQGNQSPGQYRLLNYPFNPAQGMIHGIGHDSGKHQQDYSETLATLVYDGETAALPVPDQLIPIAPLPQPETVREFNLSHGMMGLNDHAGMHQGMVFLINGKSFEHHRVDTTVQINTVEDWDITNTGTMAHPFHLHINKFQVISRNGEPEPYLAWKDVVSVAPGERVRIRVAFRDYPGKTVYHCHVLDHEDQGMMGILEMLPG